MYISHYEKTLKPEGARARKVMRMEKAKVTKTVPHRDGRHKLSARF